MTDRPERETGQLFGSLWGALTDAQYRESVALFGQRFTANGFDLAWFHGKDCLDAGTGSGRYAVAMATCGAASVTACDISETGLATARARAHDVPNVTFVPGSVLDLPFAAARFDFVCCAGVLHHTPSVERGLAEIARVLKPGGLGFLLLYGSGGLRWKQVVALRPLAAELGLATVDAAVALTGLPANNRKHFLDDLFVPIQTFISWPELQAALAAAGFIDAVRWTEGRFDHEADAMSQIADMEKLRLIFEKVADVPGIDPGARSLGAIGAAVSSAFVDEARRAVASADMGRDAVERLVIGEGNHRVLVRKP